MTLTPLPPFDLQTAHLRDAVRSQSVALARTGFPAALWERRAAAWSRDRAVQERIEARLGWLTSPPLMERAVARLTEFSEAVLDEGFTDVVLLGMGRSSLAPEVLRAVIGLQPGRPRFQMLDSVNPDAIRAVSAPPETTLFILASKSGTTIEPNSLAAYFRSRSEQAGVHWPSHAVAITDPGTPLEQRAKQEGFRDIFINPADIGGRYSALSFFGLVPAALMGIDVRKLLEWARAMGEGCGAEVPVESNPGIMLGIAMAVAAQNGRDKMTLVASPSLASFGLWVEQLVAESTGKDGRGIVPVVGEPEGSPETYGNDRFFVRLRAAYAENVAEDLPLPAGAPVATIVLPEPSAIGAEFLRWEIATATAGAILRVNPFDEPNVQQAKDATSKLLEKVSAGGGLPPRPVHATIAGADATLSGAAGMALGARKPEAFLSIVRPGDYFAVLAYMPPDSGRLPILQELRRQVRDRSGAPAVLGLGPRYLHSSGQLHKGGPNNGVFLMITCRTSSDLDIPGAPFTFGTLELAQAIGDFTALDREGRRVMHVQLASDTDASLEALCDELIAGLVQPQPAVAPWERLST
jgi:glucose-6-phosphate isomerase